MSTWQAMWQVPGVGAIDLGGDGPARTWGGGPIFLGLDPLELASCHIACHVGKVGANDTGVAVRYLGARQ
jgi:hypothetical protein